MRSPGRRLEELRQAVREAEQRVARLERARRGAGRRVEAERAALRDYSRAVGAGEREPDPDEERRLVEAVRSAEAGVSMRPVLAGGRVFDVEAVDERAEGELEGAREALERARSAEAAFRAEHLAALAAERLKGAEAIGRRAVEAAGALSTALNEWEREARELASLGVPADDVPANPFGNVSLGRGLANVDRAGREDPAALVPSPRWVTEADDAG